MKTDALWLGLQETPLPIQNAIEWASQKSECGAVVSFMGNARDSSPGRKNVSALTYEAYESQVLPRLLTLAEKISHKWPDIARLVMMHRVGSLQVGDTAVLVVVASPHRDSAFEAARYGIDTLKASIPIWKKETWEDGESWGLEAQHIQEIPASPTDLNNT